MDRINISFAALQMNRDLHFSAAVYGFGAGLFFLSYAACEVPSNLLLCRFGARRWLARIMLTWGLLAMAMMFVRTPLRVLQPAVSARHGRGRLFSRSDFLSVGVVSGPRTGTGDQPVLYCVSVVVRVHGSGRGAAASPAGKAGTGGVAVAVSVGRPAVSTVQCRAMAAAYRPAEGCNLAEP